MRAEPWPVSTAPETPGVASNTRSWGSPEQILPWPQKEPFLPQLGLRPGGPALLLSEPRVCAALLPGTDNANSIRLRKYNETGNVCSGFG